MALVTVKRGAARVLRRTDRKTRQRIETALQKLEDDEERQDLDIRPLKGTEGFRLRIGDWRILFDHDREEDQITVQAIRPRGQAYKR